MEQRINDCRAAESVLHDNLTGLDHEEVWVLFLTSDHKVISKEMVSRGTLTETSIDNRTVIKRALLNNAYGIVLLHNHPSGNPRPSVQDIRFTAGMKKACDLMNINLMDHIICTDGGFFSFSEERTINHK
ncbi:MAG: JAB domain-containing protein [Bacteroidales bacterium]|nr:JAB domain-containing protein [Bacteroidales bacterium]